MADRPDYSADLKLMLKMREQVNTVFNLYIYDQHNLDVNEQQYASNVIENAQLLINYMGEGSSPTQT